MPTETQLIARYGVSRNTVREALDLLREEGLIKRSQGAGTFAVTHKVGHRFDRLHGFHDSFDKSPEIKVFEVAVYPAADIVAEKLQIDERAPALFVERLTTVGDAPLNLRSSWMPLDLARPLLGADLENRDYYDLIELDLGEQIDSAEIVLEAATASGASAVMLGIPKGSPIILLERVTRLTNGRVIEFGFSRSRGDRVMLLSEMDRTGVREGSAVAAATPMELCP